MSYFISYSHQDKDFVDRLAAELALQRRHVWVDRWELKIGSSLIQKVQDALGNASGIIVVLSRASVASEWCRKELSSGLLRELEEKRVVVLPILIEDCEIPLFLREKFYADFRVDFEKGTSQILDATAAVTSERSCRHEDPDFFHDWAIDWSHSEDDVTLTFTAVSFYKATPFSILTTITITGGSHAAKKYVGYEAMGLGLLGRALILTSIVDFVDPSRLQIPISEVEGTQAFGIGDPHGLRYNVEVRVRRLGDDPGHDSLYDYGSVLKFARDISLERCRKPTPEELMRIASGAVGNIA